MPRFNQNKIEKQQRATNQMQKTNSGFVCYVVSQWKEKNVKKEKWHDV